MHDLPHLILARDRISHGLTSEDLGKRARTGSLVRVRHGVYTDGKAWRELKPWEQYRLKVQAAAETFQTPTIFARRSSASVWGIPIIGHHHPVEALTHKNDGGRSRAGVRRHFASPDSARPVRRQGLLVTDRVRTVLDLAAFLPFTEAVAPLDHVLKPDTVHGLPALTKAELEAGIGKNYSATAARRIRAAIAFADADSGSAGESLSRALIHVHGFEAPALQYNVRTATGSLGYTDFYWKEARVVGEFDGVEKYVKPGYLNGRTTSQAVVAEKNRENRIRATGLHVARWDWADVMEPARLERALVAAGVPRRRTRSAVLDAQTRP